MASHFSDIGFNADSDEEIMSLLRQAAQEGQPVESTNGHYLFWSPEEGIQLWLQVDPEGTVIGFNPHLAGKGRIRAALTEEQPEPDMTMEGGFHAWADPSGESPDTGAYPFLFDMPDYDRYRGHLALPQTVNTQIAAFAHELYSFADEDAYASFQRENDLRFTPESFVSSGLLIASEAKTEERPEATAVFTGRVLETERRTNPTSGRPFYHLHVRTLGGTFDVAADPDIIQGEPVPGGIVQGSFWLSGRIIDS
ncbi:hypothetical protein [Paludifilum halophilum]|uniref:Uncharacterized protein n=1 Tax=Paludifilum halophilum TaxID=1642702 RepID=A0A235B5R2_9BACL|nr:hypothetical protein [Paludifilum halophilum]OYD07630.1 hypothetical protein CHM34_09110 [Paludifilum halophilum]